MLWPGSGVAKEALVEASIVSMLARTPLADPRRRACRARMPDQVSIWFIQEALVGVPWKR